MYVALSYLSYLRDLGFEGAKRWGDALKSPFGVAMQATSGGGDNFNGEGGGSGGFLPCKNAALKLYCKSYWEL